MTVVCFFFFSLPNREKEIWVVFGRREKWRKSKAFWRVRNKKEGCASESPPLSDESREVSSCSLFRTLGFGGS